MDRVVWSVRSLVLITVALQMVALTAAAPSGDLIPSLPGQPEVDFKQYGGYITVHHTKQLFYYFVEAVNSSATKPLVLWLNGGPGCSSLQGAFEELGPFKPNIAGDGLILNNDSWNQAANIIFLDSPVGVGFSYSKKNEDYVTNDTKTAADTLAFIIGWLKAFPEYKSRDLYLTGESYGGHYLPQLAAAILESNKVSGSHQILLKGIMVGNPLFDLKIDQYEAPYVYAYAHGMISEGAYNAVSKECNVSSYYFSKSCIAAIEIAVNESGYNSGYLDPYDVLADVCKHSGGEAHQLREMVAGKVFPPPGPCINGELKKYLNRKEIESALHAEVSGWASCDAYSDHPKLHYDNRSLTIPISPILVNLLEANLSRVWVYSGDADLVVPVVGTRRIVTGVADILMLNTTSKYQLWYQGSQIGGWSMSWGSLVFATVRGAGHMVPQTQPARALVLFRSFLAGHKSPPIHPA